MKNTIPNYKDLFESTPGLYLILLPDEQFTILTVNEAYLQATMTKREEITGHGLFEIFPDNPDDPKADGVSNLRNSLNEVLKSKKAHTMAVQQYDIRKNDGTFEKRYWSPLNKPVLNENGEVTYIIHRVENVTEFITLKKEQEKKDEITEALRSRMEEMEIFVRAQEIQKLNIDLEQKINERTSELQKSERKFRSLIENNYDAITLNDSKGARIYQSPSAERMLGWSLNERTGSGFDLIHPDDVNNLKNIYNKVLSNPGKSFISTHRIKHKNGTYIWLEGKMTNLLNDPSIGAVVSNFQDITERKKLEEQQALFSSIINSSDDAIISKTLDGTITSWNRGAEILFGYSATETLGKSISILMPASHLPEENDIMHRIKNGKSVDHYETERLKKDGTVIFVSLTVSPIRDPAGKIIGASKIVRDITEKRNANKKIAASEKLFRSIVQNIPKSLVIVMDRDHKFLMIEGGIMERLGYKRQDYEGKHPLEVSPKEQYEASKPLYDRVFNGEHFSIERSSPIGDYIVHFVPIRDGNGSVESAMVIALDISEIKKAQKEIEELNKNLEKKVEERTEQLLAVNKELEAFSYSVSHDLRAPLRAIDGFAKILEEDYNTVFDEEGKRLLSIVQYNARKMAELIDNLLAFSRLGKKEVQKTKIDMTELVQGALMDLNKSIKHHVEVKIHDLHVVWGDYALLHQLFFNLISNGIKYSSKKKKPIVEINSAEKNGEVIFSVADNGVGFDMQYANKLFGVFQRLHSIDEFEGTGVGLAIVQRIANKHHGKVWAESKPGKGATFYFSIPTDFSIIK